MVRKSYQAGCLRLFTLLFLGICGFQGTATRALSAAEDALTRQLLTELPIKHELALQQARRLSSTDRCKGD